MAGTRLFIMLLVINTSPFVFVLQKTTNLPMICSRSLCWCCSSTMNINYMRYASLMLFFSGFLKTWRAPLHLPFTKHTGIPLIKKQPGSIREPARKERKKIKSSTVHSAHSIGTTEKFLNCMHRQAALPAFQKSCTSLINHFREPLHRQSKK